MSSPITPHKKHVMVIGVLGLAINDKGEFLLTQRHEPHDPAVHGLWQLPGGGMEFGESPEQTLAREMQEELGVSARILSPLPIAKTSVRAGTDFGFHVTLLTYLISIDSQTPKIADEETAAYGWYTLDQVHTLPVMGLTEEVIEEAQRHILHLHQSNV